MWQMQVSRYMLDDSYSDIEVYKCWVCVTDSMSIIQRDRVLSCVPDGGDDLDMENELGYCKTCLRLLTPHVEPMMRVPIRVIRLRTDPLANIDGTRPRLHV